MTELVEDVAALKEQVKSTLKRVDDLEKSVKILPRMETLMEINIETNKKQSDTLNNINSNLTKLNNSYDYLTTRIGTIEDDVKTSRKNSSIDVNRLTTETVFKIIPSILGGLILAWLIFQLKLK